MSIRWPNWQTIKAYAVRELQRGITPRSLALALSLGFALGCIPLIGIPTALCAIVAYSFGLSQPAIQVANYLAMPFQLLLIVPFARLGAWMDPFTRHHELDIDMIAHSPLKLLRHSSVHLLEQLGIIAGQAVAAWLIIAVPAVLLLTAALTRVIRRITARVPAQLAGYVE